MATVFFAQPLRQHTAGVERMQVNVDNYRDLVEHVAARFPALRHTLQEELSVAIDGEIIHEPFLEAVGPDSEVHFLHRISGG